MMDEATRVAIVEALVSEILATGTARVGTAWSHVVDDVFGCEEENEIEQLAAIKTMLAWTAGVIGTLRRATKQTRAYTKSLA